MEVIMYREWGRLSLAEGSLQIDLCVCAIV
jgi:hypothetical protein